MSVGPPSVCSVRTTTPPPSSANRRPALGPPDVEAEDVFGLGAGATLAYVVERRRRQDAAAAEELRAVTAWADLHRVQEPGVVGSVDEITAEELDRRRLRGQSTSLLGLEGELRLAGEGVFMVEEFAVCQLAPALSMSEPAARRYVGQAMELRERLPRLFDRVMAGVLPAWKARQIAEQTIPLNAAAADYVDAQLAPFAHKIGLTRALRCVAAAILRHDPDLAAARAAEAAEGRGVWIDDRIDGTSEITAVTGTPDARAVDQALNALATTLGELGDTDPRQVRRAKALGILADPQAALDLGAAADSSPATAGPAGPATTTPSRRTPGNRPTPLHVHLHLDAVNGVLSAEGTGHLARVGGVGPRALRAVEAWLRDLAPGAMVKLTPVIDLADNISVDAYEAPDRLRAQVDERDDCCRFPRCGRNGRYDLDHIDPYVDPNDGGPPGETSTANLARLCRFHHRVKTHATWTYERVHDAGVLWTSPLGRQYYVDETGTLPR